MSETVAAGERWPEPLSERSFGPFVLRWYPAHHPSSDLEIVIGIGGAIVGAALLLLPLRLIAPLAGQCQFHMWTGWPCLSCGLTRGVLALSTGQIGAALRSNPLFIGVLMLGLAYTPPALALWLARRPRPRIGVRGRGGRWMVAAIVVAAVIANWVFLVVDGR